MKIFIVVPAHNEERRIGKFLKELSKTGYQIVVVDDGSNDDTFKIAQKYADYTLRHKVNLGKGAAMKTGSEFALKMSADAIIYMDSDGQHEVSDLNKFVNKLKEGFDIVYGVRQWHKNVPKERLMGNKIIAWVISFLFKTQVSDILCGYRGITTKAYKKIKWDSSSYGVETEMIIRASKAGLNYCEVPVSAVYLESYKGMTISHSVGLISDVIRWRIRL